MCHVVRKIEFSKRAKAHKKPTTLPTLIADVLQVPLSCYDALDFQLKCDIRRRERHALETLELLKDLIVDEADLPKMRRIWFQLKNL